MTASDPNDAPREGPAGPGSPGGAGPPAGGERPAVPPSGQSDRPPPPSGPVAETTGGGDAQTDIKIAVLLAVAAVIVAVVGGRAALLGDQGSDTWQAAIREDVKRSAGIVEDGRFLFAEEVPQALIVEESKIRERELARVARGESGTVRGVLEAESRAQKEVREPIDKVNELAGDPKYKLAEDGVVRRLADQRAKNPDLMRLDPDATADDGGNLGLKSTWLIASTVIVAIAFLLGALAEGFETLRRPLVPAGFAFAGAGLMAAVIVEIFL